MRLLFQFHKKRTSFLFSSILVVLMCSCASMPVNNATNVKRYAAGEGGGFTGEYTEFSFGDDGKVYKRDFNYQRDVFIKQLSDADLKYFLNKINDLGVATIDINAPGNMSKYIEIREGETSLNRIVWGSNTYYPPNNLVEFHQELYKKLSALE